MILPYKRPLKPHKRGRRRKAQLAELCFKFHMSVFTTFLIGNFINYSISSSQGSKIWFSQIFIVYWNLQVHYYYKHKQLFSCKNKLLKTDTATIHWWNGIWEPPVNITSIQSSFSVKINHRKESPELYRNRKKSQPESDFEIRKLLRVEN